MKAVLNFIGSFTYFFNCLRPAACVRFVFRVKKSILHLPKAPPMRLKTLCLSLLVIFSIPSFAKVPGDSTVVDDSTLTLLNDYMQYVDSVKSVLKYESGKINLGHASLHVPEGFKYLNADQSRNVIVDIWGNPETAAEDVLGMIFPGQSDPFDDSSYAFIISYSEIGFVKDDDAKDINYDDLLKTMREDQKAENEERKKAGYEPIALVGWAQKPFYDEKRKILHWAKALKFGDSDGENTLNYDIRILGRKGILSLNAVSKVSQLPMVNKDIPKILDIASFTEGNTYSDFNPDVDDVAAWTIGGLVAGKILAKAGFFAVILKFLAPLWKFLMVALIPIGAWVRKRFMNKKEDQLATAPLPTDDTPQANA